MHGYLSEHHSFGETDERAGEYAEDLAATMLATTLGIEFNPELDWDAREHLFKMSGKIVRTSNITQSAVGNKDGLWTTVFAAAVFINDDSLAIETERSQGQARWGNEDSCQDEVSSQTPEPHESVTTTHDQHEVTKALHQALQQKLERSPREKDTSKATIDGVLKVGRPKLLKPL
jgi:hypothetical protein